MSPAPETRGDLFEPASYRVVCGIDEAGRGPLAGPVSAAAVILPDDFPLSLLDDSKALSEKARNAAFEIIATRSRWANEWAWPSEIDELNILWATMLAMRRAFLRLGAAPDIVIVDGTKTPDIPCARRAMVKADALVPAVMAASIVAKVSRDRMMERYDWLYPEYGYARHKGYPTAAHRAACRALGPSPIQRMSFKYSKE
ncbi:MAG: ribonuclease HII [Spirochaetae bacterium HGW-Spirochaetae-3]|nr:MAG: ribonuclease HII [Spirochaetae bacterium HGW-Spirochaetae-3]